MTPDLADRIRQRLAEYLADSAPDPLDLRSVVAKFGGLPLTLDMGGCLAIRADGEVISFQWDEPHDVRVEQDAHWRNVALYQGSLKYPELAPLVPARPIDARPCEHCAGVA
ncbi:MAG: hypothetical protein ACREOE_06360, partial [Gemmatimonadales bacterium]